MPSFTKTDASYSGVIPLTAGTTYNRGKAVVVNASVVGNVSMQMADGSTVVVPVLMGYNLFPFAITAINTSGTTATATYYNLYQVG